MLNLKPHFHFQVGQCFLLSVECWFLNSLTVDIHAIKEPAKGGKKGNENGNEATKANRPTSCRVPGLAKADGLSVPSLWLPTPLNSTKFD
jgi:hypothetical protein